MEGAGLAVDEVAVTDVHGLLQEPGEFGGNSVYILQFAFPDYKHFPSGAAKRLQIPCVPLDRSREFRGPVAEITFRNVAQAATLRGMAMPKTAVDQDGLPVPWQDYIRAARQVVAVKPEAKAHCVDEGPHLTFWPRVVGTDRTHDG